MFNKGKYNAIDIANWFLNENRKQKDSIDWNENPYGFVRLCNNIEVDEFLKKILS